MKYLITVMKANRDYSMEPATVLEIESDKPALPEGKDLINVLGRALSENGLDVKEMSIGNHIKTPGCDLYDLQMEPDVHFGTIHVCGFDNTCVRKELVGSTWSEDA